METDYLKSSISINANVQHVWNFLSKITSLDWLEGQKSSKFLSKEKRGIGAMRLISFKDGSNVEECIVGWIPKKYFSYIAITGLPFDAYHATISMNQVSNVTKVTWESYFSSKQTRSEFIEFKKFLFNFYTLSLEKLKNQLE